MPQIHPPKDQLMAFGQGKLAADESSQIEQHLGVCPECCETLLDLKDDTFTGLVRAAKAAQGELPLGVADAGNRDGADATEPDPEHADQRAGVGMSAAATVGVAASDTRLVDDLPNELEEHSRYHIVELIGRGGMGSVYRAEHRLMNRPVAIKVINSQLVQNAQAVERFRREVQAAAKLSHPNIVAAYDAEQAGSVHFLAMEFVDGTDLATVVHERGPLPVAEACEYIRQAAVGLQHAHELGMVHRDIKPHNLMVTSRESRVESRELGTAGDSSGSGLSILDSRPSVKILDFGLAGFVTESAIMESEATAADPGAATIPPHLTALGSVMGTPDYIAPEQASDAHSADIRADIYSLGCSLYFLLTGRPPYEADGAVAKLMAHVEQPVPDLKSQRPDVPPQLAAVVSRMMAKKPADRFQTPAEVAAALAPFARAAEAPPRKRTLRNVLAAAAAILLAGVIYIVTDKGRLEIRTDVDDVDVVVSQGGREIKTIDLATGSQVTWMPSGDYTISLKQDRNDIQITPNGFKLSRWGKQIVSLSRLPATAAKTDHEQIQGTWIAESGQRYGEATPFDKIDMQRMVFDGDKLRVEGPGGKKGEGHFQLTETANPKRIGVLVTADTRGLRGIYKLEGDRLTICLDKDQSADVPKAFAAPVRSTLDLIVLRREGDLPRVFDEFLGEFNEVIRWRRGLLSAEQERKLLAFRGELHPDWLNVDQLGPIEIFASLPDSAHAELRKTGYLKWRFADVLPNYQTVYRRGHPSWVQHGEWKPESIETSEVGFAVVQLANSKVVSAFILYPDDMAEAWSTVVGVREHRDNDHRTEHLKQIRALRAKPLTQPPATDAAQGPPNDVVDQMLLQGLWIAVSGHSGGQPIPAERLPKFSITIDQDQVAITPPSTQSQVRHGTFKNDVTSTPRRIDIVVMDKNEPMVGIYEVDQKRLKLALVDGDAARPTDFSPSDRSGHIAAVFERAPYTGATEYVEFRPAGLNGSFEITQYGLPVNWHLSTRRTAPESDFDIEMDTTDFKEGKQSLKFVVRKCDEKRGPGFTKEFAENQNPPAAFETKPGETYKVSFWAKNAGSEFVFRARGVSAFGGDEGTVIRSKETFNEWRRFECTHTIPPKMWLQVGLKVVQPGTFWIDDLQIVKVIPSDEVRLQGKWIAISGHARKQPIPAEQLAKLAIAFEDDHITFDQPGVPSGSQRGTFKLNPNSSPKQITLVASRVSTTK